MQINHVKSEGLQKEFLCTIAVEDIDKNVHSKLEEVRSQAKIPGFRPGKVPIDVIKKRCGNQALSEALENLCNEATTKALSDHNYRAATQPKVDVANKYEEGKPLELKINVEVLPEINVKDMSDFTFERLQVEASEADYEKALKNVVEGFLVTRPVESAASDQHIALIDYTFCLEEGETREFKDQKIALTSDFAQERLQGQLKGKKAGDTLTAVYTFPADFENAKLAGKSVEYQLTLKEVHEFIPVQEEDLIAKELHLDSKDNLKKDIQGKLNEQYAKDAFFCLKRQVLDKLSGEYDFPVPFSMVQSEMDAIKHSIQQESQEEKTFSEDELKGFEKLAERRVRLGLLLAEISREHNIKVTEKELQEEVVRQGQQHPEGPSGLLKYLEKNPQTLEYIKAPLLEDKVIQHLVETMKITDKTVTGDELKKHFEDINKDDE